LERGLSVFCSNDPLDFFDYAGLWRILINLPADRTKAGDLILYDDKGKPYVYAVARGQGNNINKKLGTSIPWYRENGDTPTGVFKGSLDESVKKFDQYGNPPYVRFTTGVSGHAKDAYGKYRRSGLLIHAGRTDWQQDRIVTVIIGWKPVKGKDGAIRYEPIYKKEKRKVPANTSGCIRLTQEDLDSLTTQIKCLIKGGEPADGSIEITGPQEEPPRSPKK
jgi:hypothetical protein